MSNVFIRIAVGNDLLIHMCQKKTPLTKYNRRVKIMMITFENVGRDYFVQIVRATLALGVRRGRGPGRKKGVSQKISSMHRAYTG